MKLKFLSRVVGVIILTLLLISCASQPKTKLDGAHLHQEETPEEKGLKFAPPPKPVSFRPILPKPIKLKKQKLYSVSAINVPVKKLLYKLAADANRQLSLSQEVQGNVTLIVKDKSLDFIVKHIAEQVGANYQVTPQIIKIYPDRPYWQTYRVDYVNLLKKTQDDSLLNMSIGKLDIASGSDSISQGNQSSVSVETLNDFWGTLHKNIKVLLGTEENSKSSQPSDNTDSGQNATAGQVDQSVVSHVLINKEAGLLSVYATTKKQAQIKRFLDQVFTRANKQVLIEATVVEVELSDRYQAGIDWSLLNSLTHGELRDASFVGTNLSTDPLFSINLVSKNGGFNFNLGLKMLQQFGKTKVLSSPKIMTMNNQMALLKVVDNEVYFTIQAEVSEDTTSTGGTTSTTTYTSEVHTVPVGFMMSVIPFVSDNDSISLNIRPTLSRILRYVDDPNPDLGNVPSKIPVIQEREMSSVLRLQDKQTAIIGGLIQNSTDKNNSGVPLLKDIPGIGNLFKYRDDTTSKTELVVFIRPRIIRNPDVNFGDLNSLKRFLPKAE
ncbi:pilus (MSHA type) biogenesis protein MshL [Galenea microaerophila]